MRIASCVKLQILLYFEQLFWITMNIFSSISAVDTDKTMAKMKPKEITKVPTIPEASWIDDLILKDYLLLKV